MKTALKVPCYHTTQGRPNGKHRTARSPSRKRKELAYPSLNEFLSQYPVATVNEYGERVIYGRRIC